MDNKVKNIEDIPYTISYVVRKRQQLDSFAELPKDKQPPEMMIWEGRPEEMEEWFDKVISGRTQSTVELQIREDEIE